MYEQLTIKKEYLEEADITTFTIELPDGQSLTLNEYEYETLKEQIKKI